MDNWFENKWFIRIASLVFAILLYVVVDFEQTTTQQDARVPGDIDTDRIQTLHDVPVHIKIDSEKYVVSGAQELVSVSFEGSNSVLIPTVMQRNFEFYIDLIGLGEGTYTVDILYSNVPEELKVYIEPKTIDITIEERVAEEFAVHVDYINLDQFPVGYEISAPKINPEVVMITSSRSIFDQISMVKVYIDVADLTESINNREVPVNVYDAQGNVLSVRIEPETVVISAEVDNPSKTIPIEISTINEPPEDIIDYSITLDRENIEVFAISDILEELEVIQTEEIDLAEITESGTLDIKLDLPEDVLVDDDTLSIDIEVEKMKVFEEVAIAYYDLAPDQEIVFVSPSEAFMSMTIIGNDQDIDELDQEDFQLSIDVQDLSEGEHVVPVTIDGSEHVETSIEHEEINIRIIPSSS